MEHIDIVFKTEAKRRSSVKPEVVRWNAKTHVLEYWNGVEWKTAYEDMISGESSLELEKHKADPQGHPLATKDRPGFMSAAYAAKLDGINGIDSLGPLDPDPSEIFNLVLKS